MTRSFWDKNNDNISTIEERPPEVNERSLKGHITDQDGHNNHPIRGTVASKQLTKMSRIPQAFKAWSNHLLRNQWTVVEICTLGQELKTFVSRVKC